MTFLKYLPVAALAFAAVLFTTSAKAEDPYIIVASTTSTQNSGLFDYILPKFKEATGIAVRVVAVGTGQALQIGRNGDADVLFVHDRVGEDKFVAEGYAEKRFDVMYNDFVIIGPESDPAKVGGVNDVTDALRKIVDAKSIFVSRGDDSGTNRKEMRLWKDAAIDPKPSSGKWYREAGAGMGAALNTALGMDGYVLSDRATWLNFSNKGRHKILVEGDARMFNPYGVMLINPKKYPHVKAEMGRKFIDWLISETGQKTISEYKIKGDQAFFPDAANPPKGS